MLVAHGGGKMLLPIFKVKSLTPSHHQLGIMKLLISLSVFQLTPCHVLIFHFAQTKVQLVYFLFLEQCWMKDCNSLFNYFLIVLSNRHFTPSQSGCLPEDSCIVQSLSIIHEIQTALDKNPTADVKGVFLDISKAFHKVWHDGVESLWCWTWTVFATRKLSGKSKTKLFWMVKHLRWEK